MSRKKLDSVNDCARHGYNLRFTCNGCARVVEANAILLQQELHARRASMLLDTLERRAKCKVCGHRGAIVTPCEINF